MTLANTPRSTWLKNLFHAIGAGSVAVLAASGARAAELSPEQKSFDIPAQPIAMALMQFSRQADVQVLADAGKLGKARSQPLSGRFSPERAISILLSQSGLLYEVTASNTIVVSNQKSDARNRNQNIRWNGDGARMMLVQALPTSAAPISSGTAGTPAQSVSTSAAGSENLAPLEEIAVTATRIQRSGFNAPTPTTIVGVEELDARSAVNVSNVLYEMPAVRSAASMTVATQNQGGNFISLRGLGATRTLTLVDGRRFVPTTMSNVAYSWSAPLGGGYDKIGRAYSIGVRFSY